MTEPLFVDDTGNPDGPPILFVHGFMSSNLQWEPNRAGLGAELRLLLTEQPGHGRSPGPDDLAAYRTDAVLEQLDQIRADRGIDQWWVAGQSLGGAMVVRYALRHPDRVRGVVFTNSRAVFGVTGRRAERQLREQVANSAAGNGGDDDASDHEDGATERAGADGADRAARGRRRGGLPTEPTRQDIQALPYHPRNARRIPEDLKARMVEVADAMPMAVFRHLRNAGPWKSSDELHQLEVPTLLINGRFEKVFQPCVAEARASVPDLRVVDLDGGHSVNIDQPEAFNAAVLEFVAATGQC
ncbi:MAG: alpha/beta hydrolase [Actinomycetota bacterium]